MIEYKYIQVTTTTDNRELAEKIAGAALKRKLAACVQISQCQSMYHWQEKIERAEEFVCVMKSRMDLYPELEQTIRKEHTYEVPEILVSGVTAGSSDYLAWLDGELRREGGSR
ncbi:MAG: divalent-cation tolerance protein CutA [Desulfobulbaceae bacterium]|nr:divalent-cation tolerance protein CutA [Desulfobulbaceae bacterium]